MNNIYKFTQADLINIMEQNHFPKYRAKQIFKWLYTKGIDTFDDMQNLPKDLKAFLNNNYTLDLPTIKKIQVSKLDSTTKFLLQYNDKSLIETVLMFHKEKSGKTRKTLCISSQVGCPIGCLFCATGKIGFSRNLKVEEIIGEILIAIKKHNNIHNIVYMGMGEPLLNYDNVIKTIKIITDMDGLNFSSRKISLSTCGLVPEIKRLANEKIPLTLAISLHAANNRLRNKLVPINKKYPIEDLIISVKEYIESTNRKVTFEYIMIKDINDTDKDAFELAELLKGILCNVNLIPANSVMGSNIERTPEDKVLSFCNKLQSLGIETVIRKEKGSDIDAACGQLRAKSNN